MHKGSEADPVLAQLEGLLQSVVSVATDKVLEQQLTVSEVAGIILERLAVASDESLLEVGGVPDPLFHLSRL